MELLLQGSINYKLTHSNREKMIRIENLHISDQISLERFEELYAKYGHGCTELEFAKYFLDINYRGYYNIKNHLKKSTAILELEYYLEEEFDFIEQKLLAETGLMSDDLINFEQLQQLYNTYGDRFSLTMFAYEVLGVSAHTLSDLKWNKNLNARILKFGSRYNREIIQEIKENVIRNSGLHMGDTITLKEFDEFYTRFGLNPKIERKVFAHKILGISNDLLFRLEKGIKSKVHIFSHIPLNPSYIDSLRQIVIKKESLKIDDSIDLQQFAELYQKYGGILSEELFAENILDISWETLKRAKSRNNSLTILGNVSIPDEYINELQSLIKTENELNYNHQITLEEFYSLYKKYGEHLTEIDFAEKVLNIESRSSYYRLMSGSANQTHIFVEKSFKDFEDLRKRIIRENNLHYGDQISYGRFKEIHIFYGEQIKEHIFAREILDISQSCLDNMRHNGNKSETTILLSERLPNSGELVEIKERVISETRLYRRAKIKYDSFVKLYNKYGGILPEDMFAERILDISISSLHKMHYNHDAEVFVFIHSEMSEEKIKQLRNDILMEYELYPNRMISLKTIENIYERYPTLLSLKEFEKKILGISGKKDLNQLAKGKTVPVNKKNNSDYESLEKNGFFNKHIEQIETMSLTLAQFAVLFEIPLSYLNQQLRLLNATDKINLEDIVNRSIEISYLNGKDSELIASEHEIPVSKVLKRISEFKKLQKENESDIKVFNSLESVVKRIIENYLYDGKRYLKVKKYIDLCKQLFKHDKFPEEKLEFLGECIEFVQGNTEDIVFFARACVKFKKYELAYKSIIQNRNNDGISEEEKYKLFELSKQIKYAMNKKQAFEMLKKGNYSHEVIIEITQIKEIELLILKRMLNEGLDSPALTFSLDEH